MEVEAPADEGEEPPVVGGHVGAPDGGGACDTPLFAGAVVFDGDGFGLDFALAVGGVRAVVAGTFGLVSRRADELGGCVDGAPDGGGGANGFAEVGDTEGIGEVVVEGGSAEVGAGGEVDDDFGLKVVEGLGEGVEVEDVESLAVGEEVRVGVGPDVDAEDFVSFAEGFFCGPFADEAGGASDENFHISG